MESAAFVSQVVNTLHSWFTPTVLFVLINIVVGTLAVTYRMRPNNPNKLRRSPSLLARMCWRTYEEDPLATWTQPENTLTSQDNLTLQPDVETEEKRSKDNESVQPDVKTEGKKTKKERLGVSQRVAEKKSKLGRSKSDSEPLPGLSPPPPLPGKMHKYATFEGPRMAAPPPQPVESVVEEEEDAEVNAKADDFINKFKQQLKLQRLESLMRYKDMLGRT